MCADTDANAIADSRYTVEWACHTERLRASKPPQVVPLGDFELRVQIWDLAGGADFLDVRNEFYKAREQLRRAPASPAAAALSHRTAHTSSSPRRNAAAALPCRLTQDVHAALFVYDSSQRDSFMALPSILDETRRYAGNFSAMAVRARLSVEQPRGSCSPTRIASPQSQRRVPPCGIHSRILTRNDRIHHLAARWRRTQLAGTKSDLAPARVGEHEARSWASKNDMTFLQVRSGWMAAAASVVAGLAHQHRKRALPVSQHVCVACSVSSPQVSAQSGQNVRTVFMHLFARAIAARDDAPTGVRVLALLLSKGASGQRRLVQRWTKNACGV